MILAPLNLISCVSACVRSRVTGLCQGKAALLSAAPGTAEADALLHCLYRFLRRVLEKLGKWMRLLDCKFTTLFTKDYGKQKGPCFPLRGFVAVAVSPFLLVMCSAVTKSFPVFNSDPSTGTWSSQHGNPVEFFFCSEYFLVSEITFG